LVGIREVLAELIPSEKASLMYRSYDVIGDIAVAKIPSELNDYEKEVGNAIHKLHPGVRTVFRVIGETKEIERNRELRLIWTQYKALGTSDRKTADDLGRTIYNEHGCRFIVDVRRVFFTPRLSHERMRIARQVKPGEVIANMFGGVGTYAIIIAKVCPEVKKIYNIDVNPIACKLADTNITMNQCSGKVTSILGDAEEVCKDRLKGLCNRVIMALPECASLFLGGAITALKEEEDCTVNFYAEVTGRHVEEQVQDAITEAKKKMYQYGVSFCEATGWRIVREVGGRRYHVAIDFKVHK
jgi:tRNA (guanine37-N1)-methyltransferase